LGEVGTLARALLMHHQLTAAGSFSCQGASRVGRSDPGKLRHGRALLASGPVWLWSLGRLVCFPLTLSVYHRPGQLVKH